jgi:hypothetical protein
MMQNVSVLFGVRFFFPPFFTLTADCHSQRNFAVRLMFSKKTALVLDSVFSYNSPGCSTASLSARICQMAGEVSSNQGVVIC